MPCPRVICPLPQGEYPGLLFSTYCLRSPLHKHGCPHTTSRVQSFPSCPHTRVHPLLYGLAMPEGWRKCWFLSNVVLQILKACRTYSLLHGTSPVKLTLPRGRINTTPAKHCIKRTLLFLRVNLLAPPGTPALGVVNSLQQRCTSQGKR